MQSRPRRECAEHAKSDSDNSSDAAEEPAQESLSPEHGEAGEASSGSLAPMTAAAMAERASKAFVSSAGGPAASKLLPMAHTVTKELVHLAFKVANDTCKERGKELSRAFGNFDRVVALGWLIGDALGMPPMDMPRAHAVGLKARRIATELESAQAAKRKEATRVASRLAADDPKRKELKEQGEAAAAELLRDEVVLPLGAAAERVRSQPTGSRKRAREPARSEWDVEIETAHAEHAAAQKAVARLDSAWAAAVEVAASKGRVLNRFTTKLEAALAQKKTPECRMKPLRLGMHNAEYAWREANEAATEAQTEWLLAQIDERDARRTSLELEYAALEDAIGQMCPCQLQCHCK